MSLESQKRLQGDIKVCVGLSALHPNKVLSQPARLPFSQLPVGFLKGRRTHEVEEQYRKTNCVFCWLGKRRIFR